MKIRAKNLSIITNNKLCSVPSSGLILINFVTCSAYVELEIKLSEKPVIMFRKKSINGIFEKLFTIKYNLTVIKKGNGIKVKKMIIILKRSSLLIVSKNSS